MNLHLEGSDLDMEREVHYRLDVVAAHSGETSIFTFILIASYIDSLSSASIVFCSSNQILDRVRRWSPMFQ